MRRLTASFLAVFILPSALGVYACGGSDDPKTFEQIQNECEQAIELLCKRACECGSSAGNCISIGENDTSEAKWGSQENCKQFLLDCSTGGNPDVSYGECLADVQAADCVAVPSGEAIERPKSCDAPGTQMTDGGKG